MFNNADKRNPGGVRSPLYSFKFSGDKIELILFSTFLLISLVLVALGLYRLEHTELSLVGFIFMFLLSIVIIGGNLTYQTGETVQINNTFNNESLITSSLEVTTYDYTTYEDGSGIFTTKRFGYILAVMSGIGMIGSFVSIRPEEFFK